MNPTVAKLVEAEHTPSLCSAKKAYPLNLQFYKTVREVERHAKRTRHSEAELAEESVRVRSRELPVFVQYQTPPSLE